MIAQTNTLEDVFERAYCRPDPPIRALPPIIDGRTYFNKARERRKAMEEGWASPTVGVYTPNATRGKLLFTSRALKYHWQDSRCVSVRRAMLPKERILNGADFIEVSAKDQCSLCLCQFDNA